MPRRTQHLLISLILVKFAPTYIIHIMNDNDLKDLGVVEAPVEVAPQPQVQQPQTVTQTPQAQVEQPQTQVQPQTDEVLSLNDEVVTAPPTAATEPLTPTIEVDRGAILNELFGTSNADDIKQKLTQLEQLQAEVEKPRYQSKFAEYVDQLVSKYGDPKSQSDVFKKTIDILTTDVDALDSKTAIAFQMKQDYPSLSDDDINTLISSKYNLTDYATEEQQKIGAVQLKIDSEKAKLGIKEMQATAFKDVPSKAAELRKVDEQKRALEWNEKSKDVANQINSFEFEIEKGKKMKFDVPQADRALLADVAKDIAINSGIHPDQNGLKQIEDIVKMTYVYQNVNKLVANAYKKGLSQSNSEWAAKVNNPSGLKNTAGGLNQEQRPKDIGDLIQDIMDGRA